MKIFDLRTLHPELVFPCPPFRIEEGMFQAPTLNSDALMYLQQIRDWRTAVLEFLGRSDAANETAIPGLSQRAREALENFLASSWSPDLTQYAHASPYNIMAFPTAALGTGAVPDLQTVFQVLRWRAGISDYIDDVCFAIGEPALDLDECGAIYEFIRGRSKEPSCHLCMTVFPKDRLHPDSHMCLLLRHVRAKWPVIPIFEKWKNEAAKSSGTEADHS